MLRFLGELRWLESGDMRVKSCTTGELSGFKCSQYLSVRLDNLGREIDRCSMCSSPINNCLATVSVPSNRQDYTSPFVLCSAPFMLYEYYLFKQYSRRYEQFYFILFAISLIQRTYNFVGSLIK